MIKKAQVRHPKTGQVAEIQWDDQNPMPSPEKIMSIFESRPTSVSFNAEDQPPSPRLPQFEAPEVTATAPRPEAAATRNDPEAMELLRQNLIGKPVPAVTDIDPDRERMLKLLGQSGNQPGEGLGWLGEYGKTLLKYGPTSGLYNLPGGLEAGAAQIGRGLKQMAGRPLSADALEAMQRGDMSLAAREMGMLIGPFGVGMQGPSMSTEVTEDMQPVKPEAEGGLAKGLANVVLGGIGAGVSGLMATTPVGAAFSTVSNLGADVPAIGKITEPLMAPATAAGLAQWMGIKDKEWQELVNQTGDLASQVFLMKKAEQMGLRLPHGSMMPSVEGALGKVGEAGRSARQWAESKGVTFGEAEKPGTTMQSNIIPGTPLEAMRKVPELLKRANTMANKNDVEELNKVFDTKVKYDGPMMEGRPHQQYTIYDPTIPPDRATFIVDPTKGQNLADEFIARVGKFAEGQYQNALEGKPTPQPPIEKIPPRSRDAYGASLQAGVAPGLEAAEARYRKLMDRLEKKYGTPARTRYSKEDKQQLDMLETQIFRLQNAVEDPTALNAKLAQMQRGKEIPFWMDGKGRVGIGKPGETHFTSAGKNSGAFPIRGRIDEGGKIIGLWGEMDDFPPQKLTDTLFELVAQGKVKKDAIVYFSDGKYLKLRDAIAGGEMRQELAPGTGEAIKALKGVGSWLKRNELIGTGLKHKVDRDAVVEQVEMNRGGFTLFSDGTPATEGHSVALGADKQIRLPADATREQVQGAVDQIMVANKSAFAKHPDLGVGGWTEGNTLYIEPVKITATPEEAAFVGKATDQKSSADLSRISAGDFGEKTFQQLGGKDNPDAVLRNLPSDLNLRMKVLNARLEREAAYRKVRGAKTTVPLGKGGREQTVGEQNVRDAMARASKYNEEVLGLPPLPKDAPYADVLQRYHDLTFEPLREALRREKEQGVPSGKDWYGKTMEEFDAQFAKDHPDITPAELKLIKTIGSPISAGTPVFDEVVGAVTAYKWYKATGKMPEYQPEGWNPKTGEYIYKKNADTGEPLGWNAYRTDAANKLRKLGDMLDAAGGDAQKVVDFMESRMSLEEAKKIAPSRVGIHEQGMPMRGAEAFFGPKTGPYTLDKTGAESEGLALTTTQDTHMARSKLGAMGLGVVKDAKTGELRPVDSTDLTPELRRQMIQMDIDMARALSEEMQLEVPLQPKQVQAVDWGIQRDFAERNGEYVDKRGSSYADSYRNWKEAGGLDRLNESIRSSFEERGKDADAGTVPKGTGEGEGKARPDTEGDAFEGPEGKGGGKGDTDFDFGLDPADQKIIMSIAPGLEGPAKKAAKYAGSINVTRMKETDEEKQAAQTKKLHEDYQAMKPELEKLLGVRLTDQEVRQAAENAPPFAELLPFETQKKIAAGVLKLRQIIAEGAAEGKFSKEYYENFIRLQAISKFAGRLLQKFNVEAYGPLETTMGKLAPQNKLMVKVLDRIAATGAKMDEVVRRGEQVDWNNAKDITKFYREYVKPTAWELFTEMRYINMLSSPLTHVINFASNLTQAAVLAPATKLGAGFAKGHTFKEAPAFYKGAYKAFPAAVERAADAFMGRKAASNLDVDQISSLGKAKNKLMIPVAKFNQAFGSVTRALEASDQFWQTIAAGGELEAGIARAKKQGLDPLQEMTRLKDEAMAEGRKWVFRDPLDVKNETGQGAVLSAIDNVTQQVMRLRGLTKSENRYARPVGHVANFFMPFVATPMNILKRGIEYSPAGFITMIKNGDKATQFSKAMIGSTVFAGAAALVANNESTWAVPTNPSDKADFYAAGKQPYSIKVGDKWYSYNKLGPLAYPIALAAAWKEYSNDPKYETVGGKVANGIAGYAKFFGDQSYVQGLTDLTKNLEGDPRSFFEETPANFMRQVVPLTALQNWVNTMLDPKQRAAEGPFDRVKAGIPGWSETLPVRVSPLGEEQRKAGSQDNLLNLSPVRAAREAEDPVQRTVSRLGLEIGVPSREVFGVRLDERKYQEFVKEVGVRTKEQIKDMVLDPDFAKMTKSEQQKSLDDVVRQVRRDVKYEMFADLYEAEEERKAVETGSEK